MSDATVIPILERPSVTVPFRGEELKIGPLELRQIGPFTRAVRYIVPGVLRMIASQDSSDGSFELDVLDLVADSTEQVQEALAVATGRPLDWIGGATLDEVVPLAKAVYEVNADFFVKRVAPLIAALKKAEPEAATPGDGMTQ